MNKKSKRVAKKHRKSVNRMKAKTKESLARAKKK